MRCPQCNKFVSMENGEAQIDSEQIDLDGNGLTITIDVLMTRNCADCSTELKQVNSTIDGSLSVEEILKQIPEGAERKLWKKILGSKDHEVEASIECSAGDVDESGGGRYKKNMITAHVDAEITLSTAVDGKDLEVSFSKDFETSESAGSFEECC